MKLLPALVALVLFSPVLVLVPAAAATPASADASYSAPMKQKQMKIRTVPWEGTLKSGQKAEIKLSTPVAPGETASFKILKNTANATFFGATLPGSPPVVNLLRVTPHGAGTVVVEYYVGTGRYNTMVRSLGTVTMNW